MWSSLMAWQDGFSGFIGGNIGVIRDVSCHLDDGVELPGRNELRGHGKADRRIDPGICGHGLTLEVHL